MSLQPFIANTDEEIKMVFDPYRLRIIYNVEKSNEPLTVKQIAAILEEPANKVHYHVKKLVDFGYFKLVKTETINGIIAKYYTNNYFGPYFGDKAHDSADYPLHIRRLTSLMDDFADSFKKDMLQYAELTTTHEGKKERGLLQLDKITMYMTRAEAIKLTNDVIKLVNQYTKEDKSKEVYTSILTIARIK